MERANVDPGSQCTPASAEPECAFQSPMPPEVLLAIMSFLEPVDLISASLVSRAWNVYCDDDALWRSICRASFGCECVPDLPHQSGRSWKSHCIEVSKCAFMHRRGAACPEPQEDACAFTCHSAYVPIVFSRLVIAIGQICRPAYVDWRAVATGSAVTAVRSDREPCPHEWQDAWMDYCRSAWQMIGNWGAITTSAHRDRSTAALQTLRRAVAGFQQGIARSAFTGFYDNWSAKWCSALDEADNWRTLVELVEDLEDHLKWEAMDSEWRCHRTPWRTDIRRLDRRLRFPLETADPWVQDLVWQHVVISERATTSDCLDALKKALRNLEYRMAWEAVESAWTDLRPKWVESTRDALDYPGIGRNMLSLEAHTRTDSFRVAFDELRRQLWREQVSVGGYLHDVAFVRLARLLLQFESGLVEGAFTRSWDPIAWRDKLLVPTTE